MPLLILAVFLKNYAQKLENSAIITLHVKISGRSAVWLAHLVWDQGVEGSNPFAPTTFLHNLLFCLRFFGRISLPFRMVGVAQSVRASDCGPEGRGFDSHLPPHLI
ncbi:predicted coding region HP0411 [Helicobacter pylori 26695]|uniref:Uncharacterized protein n=1 Tax=Helicobacter pylori (strain ATCC 700392 / 26695) TaxID=85962 RepID=O25167_HELPY|nr:predicted coding region HP0411 [Helicobacter pylori 26695]